MHQFFKRAFVAAAALSLTGCLWTPGKFVSTLEVRKDGRFTLDYRGEILFQMSDEAASAAEPWRDDMAQCRKNGATNLSNEPTVTPADDNPERPCTAAERAALKSRYERQNAERAANKARESAQMAAVFGLPGQDEASARKFAATVMKYKGWRSVTYRGKGVYLVDYHLDGRLDQDFLWPAMPDADLIVPFVAIRRRNDGTVQVTAPAFAGGEGPFGARGKMLGLPDKGGPDSKMRAEGPFTIVTDGEILTNNSEDGATAHPTGRQLRWDVSPTSNKVPEALIRL